MMANGREWAKAVGNYREYSTEETYAKLRSLGLPTVKWTKRIEEEFVQKYKPCLFIYEKGPEKGFEMNVRSLSEVSDLKEGYERMLTSQVAGKFVGTCFVSGGDMFVVLDICG